MPQEEVFRLGVGAARPRVGNEPCVADLDRTVVRLVVAVARVADETVVEVVREAHLDGRVPLVEPLHRLVGADPLQRPDARLARDREQLVVVAILEGLEPNAPSLERYVKRHPSPSAKDRRIRRATTALCTSSGPS